MLTVALTTLYLRILCTIELLRDLPSISDRFAIAISIFVCGTIVDAPEVPFFPLRRLDAALTKMKQCARLDMLGVCHEDRPRCRNPGVNSPAGGYCMGSRLSGLAASWRGPIHRTRARPGLLPQAVCVFSLRPNTCHRVYGPVRVGYRACTL